MNIGAHSIYATLRLLATPPSCPPGRRWWVVTLGQGSSAALTLTLVLLGMEMTYIWSGWAVLPAGIQPQFILGYGSLRSSLQLPG